MALAGFHPLLHFDSNINYCSTVTCAHCCDICAALGAVQRKALKRTRVPRSCHSPPTSTPMTTFDVPFPNDLWVDEHVNSFLTGYTCTSLLRCGKRLGCSTSSASVGRRRSAFQMPKSMKTTTAVVSIVVPATAEAERRPQTSGSCAGASANKSRSSGTGGGFGGCRERQIDNHKKNIVQGPSACNSTDAASDTALQQSSTTEVAPKGFCVEKNPSEKKHE